MPSRTAAIGRRGRPEVLSSSADFFVLRVSINRDAAAIVNNAHFISRQKFYGNVLGETRHRFINGVINHLPNKMVQAL